MTPSLLELLGGDVRERRSLWDTLFLESDGVRHGLGCFLFSFSFFLFLSSSRESKVREGERKYYLL